MGDASCETITNQPFGDGPYMSGNCVDANPLHFTGQQQDSESGLHYFPARHYSSQFGRFMSPDPTGIFLGNLNDPQSLNLYSYVRNNPTRMTDPSGLSFCVGDCPGDGFGFGFGFGFLWGGGGGGHWDWGGGPDGPLKIPANIGPNPNPSGVYGGGVWWSPCGFLYGTVCGPSGIPSSTGVYADIHTGLQSLCAPPFCMEFADVDKQIKSLYENVLDHLKNIADNPDSPYVPHWKVEVRAWAEEIARKATKATQKMRTGALNKYLQRIIGITIDDIQNFLRTPIIVIDPCIMNPTAPFCASRPTA